MRSNGPSLTRQMCVASPFAFCKSPLRRFTLRPDSRGDVAFCWCVVSILLGVNGVMIGRCSVLAGGFAAGGRLGSDWHLMCSSLCRSCRGRAY